MTTTTMFETGISILINTPEDALNEIYTRASEALDQHNLDFVFSNLFIEISPDSTAFAEVQINAKTSDVVYFVTGSDNTNESIPALNYTQAVRQLRALML